jgi:hypothetical protein
MDQKKFAVEKWIWTDVDFEKMGWHDCRLHGIARYEKVDRDEEEGSEGHFSEVELLLDIDYILQWDRSDAKAWKFWVAPSTLVFENVVDFQMRWTGVELDWEMDEIVREKSQYPSGRDCWRWEIPATGLDFLAGGYKQYIRRGPVLTDSSISLGKSAEVSPFQNRHAHPVPEQNFVGPT